MTYSHAKTLPAIKQASKSSEARILTHPTTANAKAIENTKNDSLSIKFLIDHRAMKKGGLANKGNKQ